MVFLSLRIPMNISLKRYLSLMTYDRILKTGCPTIIDSNKNQNLTKTTTKLAWDYSWRRPFCQQRADRRLLELKKTIKKKSGLLRLAHEEARKENQKNPCSNFLKCSFWCLSLFSPVSFDVLLPQKKGREIV